ncbi:uncharacterized protein LOC129295574 isoform X2 [Prosopis cineraria]|uniref:uncharacterized protein LOC129295574 isoform X2 n=1 Tax=Prosopis cineraria TaxID=364024 RepID=UPI0024105C36|nr:uncharacterized protein LOC129295574 isoform X2 [Prosopis cineraria]
MRFLAATRYPDTRYFTLQARPRSESQCAFLAATSYPVRPTEQTLKFEDFGVSEQTLAISLYKQGLDLNPNALFWPQLVILLLGI